MPSVCGVAKPFPISPCRLSYRIEPECEYPLTEMSIGYTIVLKSYQNRLRDKGVNKMAIAIRVKCSNCGEVLNVTGDCPCPKCGAPIASRNQGFIQIYRMGSPLGIAMGYGIYINGQPFGHLANKESIVIPVPFGSYNIHMTCGATRKCQDLVCTVSPENPACYIKGRIKAGFWTNRILIEPANPQEMPQ